MTDEEEAELDDLDEDENKDVRMTEHRWDKHVEHDAEFEASDDDEMARTNGATRPKNPKKTFIDYSKSEMEVDSGNASPVNGTNGNAAEEPAGDDGHDINDDTIEDLSTHEQPDKELPKEAIKVTEKETEKEKEEPEKTETAEEGKQADEASKETEQNNVDDDGDVGMEDSAPVEDTTTTTIKKEEIEPETAAEETADKPMQDEPSVEEGSVAAGSNAAESKTIDDSTAKTIETVNTAEVAEAEAENKESETKSEQPVEAMDVDTEKEKAPETREKSKTPGN